MLDPFKLFGRLLLAILRIGGYLFVFLAQILWYLMYRRGDKIGDAFGEFGRHTVDAMADVFGR
ncbi:MAG: hypothetical protein WDO73_26390 [Ignavibacteriota bacterium]|jgi:hypothetical protein